MKANFLRQSMLELRDGQFFELEDIQYGYILTVEADEDGWKAYLPDCSMFIRFNDVQIAGNDVFLIREDMYEGGKGHILASLDSELWERVDSC